VRLLEKINLVHLQRVQMCNCKRQAICQWNFPLEI